MLCADSYLSIVFVDRSLYFQSCREMYEAYVLHCFMRYLSIHPLLAVKSALAGYYLSSIPYVCPYHCRLIVYFLGEDEQALSQQLTAFPSSMGVHKFPLCCLSPWQMGAEFLINCKYGVFQYVVVRCCNSLLVMTLFSLGCYEEGVYSVYAPYVYIQACNCVSQGLALYSLLLFFLCAHKQLHDMKPFFKFLCIKLMIFLSFWQALSLGVMVRAGMITADYGHSAHQLAVLYRATIISCEMLIASIAFMYSFPVTDFIDRRQQKCDAMTPPPGTVPPPSPHPSSDISTAASSLSCMTSIRHYVLHNTVHLKNVLFHSRYSLGDCLHQSYRGAMVFAAALCPGRQVSKEVRTTAAAAYEEKQLSIKRKAASATAGASPVSLPTIATAADDGSSTGSASSSDAVTLKGKTSTKLSKRVVSPSAELLQSRYQYGNKGSSHEHCYHPDGVASPGGGANKGSSSSSSDDGSAAMAGRSLEADFVSVTGGETVSSYPDRSIPYWTDALCTTMYPLDLLEDLVAARDLCLHKARSVGRKRIVKGLSTLNRSAADEEPHSA